MKVLIEVEVNYPDLSMPKHIAMLRAVFEQNKVYGVKTVTLITAGRPIHCGEQIFPALCFYCNGTGVSNADNRGCDCEYCNGDGLKK